ncbi:MAG: glycosyl transferase [Rhodocyclaceae bacterium]|nr:glycosyl transferase [Rhodocyclaceae bacterium]
MKAGGFGVVAIGRNEGRRLGRCLTSAFLSASRVVYVDSGSSDSSVALARALGAEVVELDPARPFTAARARNAGFRRLLEIAPEVAYVQFVDGDCEFIPGWLENAQAFLDQHPEVAVACGRRRERHARLSIYNLLCDMEWDTPAGDARACGGDAMVRRAAFEASGGFREDLIAGEEPELCLRLRAAGWRIWRLDSDMAWHDANLVRFGQWWQRSRRAGHAFAEGAALHGGPPERHWVRESASALGWGLVLPLLVAGLAMAGGPGWLALLALYPLQVARLAWRGRRPSRRENTWRAIFLVLGKFPEMLGVLTYLDRRLRGGETRLIEYK